MDIYIVQPGDDIYKIANKFGVSTADLLRDNGMENPFDLVVGQAILITYPMQIHTVQQGDTLSGIAKNYGVTVMQLLRNNSFLSGREYIFPGEQLVIKYKTSRQLVTIGYSYPYIKKEILIKTLPYLTYLSIFNYRIIDNGKIITYGNDEEIIALAKDYGVIPLLMISSLSPQGDGNVEMIYDLLLSKDLQNDLIKNMEILLRTTDYNGINILISDINSRNQTLYINLLEVISQKAKEDGYLFYVTIDPNMAYKNDSPTYEDIDYARISQLVDGMTFLKFSWANRKEPPGPVCSIVLYEYFTANVVKLASPEKITLGNPLIGFDWELPFIPGKMHAHSMTLNSAITLAKDVSAEIQFDEVSLTPFFLYKTPEIGVPINHIVWFIDIRSISALDALIGKYQLAGSGI